MREGSLMAWSSSIIDGYVWCREITNQKQEEEMGDIAASHAKSGDVIGVGTGSSSYVGLLRLAARAKKEGLDITVIPAAYETYMACVKLGVKTATLIDAKPDWCFDGADEIGENGDVIKGRGGGLFGEKLIIASCERRLLLADKSKFVKKIGCKFPVPVETFPDAANLVESELKKLGAKEIELRLAKAKDGPILTESGGFLLDCRFEEIGDGLEKRVKQIPGVIECGLFQGYGFEYITL